jgi:hypothetical protein
MINPDEQLDRSLEEYLRSFLAEDIVLQEAIKRAEQGITPTRLDRVAGGKICVLKQRADRQSTASST